MPHVPFLCRFGDFLRERFKDPSSPPKAAPYIRYGGNFLERQPYAIGGVTGYGFAVDGDIPKMQALCDKTLNLSGDAHYQVISKSVFITFFRMEHLASTVSDDAAKGFFKETELNFTLLLAKGKRVGGIFIPVRLVWHMPYLWVNSSEAMIAGRDVYGFPKQYGTVEMPLLPGEPAHFEAAGEVLHKFGSASFGAVQPIVRARRTDADALELQTPIATLEEAAAEFIKEAIRISDPLLFIGTALADLSAKHLLALVFLKQLPSIVDGNLACYQSIAEASYDLTSFNGAGFLKGDYEVVIFKHDSVPIAAELGLAGTDSDGNARLRPHASYFADIDFTFNKAEEIWVAP